MFPSLRGRGEVSGRVVDSLPNGVGAALALSNRSNAIDGLFDDFRVRRL
jgi:hypothetical protein